MPTEKENDKDSKKTMTGAEALRNAERYVKNPEDMDKHTQERKKSDKEAKDKADADKKAAADKK